MYYKPKLIFLLITVFMVSGCSMDYWLADPYIERYLLYVNPARKISVTTEPTGARITIANVRNPQIYAGYAPVDIKYRPHPHIPSWLIIGKKGYRSTSIRIKEDNLKVHIVLAALTRDDQQGLDIMAGPMMGRPRSRIPNFQKGTAFGPPF